MEQRHEQLLQALANAMYRSDVKLAHLSGEPIEFINHHMYCDCGRCVKRDAIKKLKAIRDAARDLFEYERLTGQSREV